MHADTLLTGGVSIGGIEAVEAIIDQAPESNDMIVIIKLTLQAIIAVSTVIKLYKDHKVIKNNNGTTKP